MVRGEFGFLSAGSSDCPLSAWNWRRGGARSRETPPPGGQLPGGVAAPAQRPHLPRPSFPAAHPAGVTPTQGDLEGVAICLWPRPYPHPPPAVCQQGGTGRSQGGHCSVSRTSKWHHGCRGRTFASLVTSSGKLYFMVTNVVVTDLRI